MSCRIRPDYLPTPLEISRATAKIRARWTPHERRRRNVRGVRLEEARPVWNPPTIDTSSLRTSAGKPMFDLVS